MDRAGCLYGSVGACPIMGTANSGQIMTEAMGLALPYSSTCLGLSSEKMRIAEYTGRRIVEMVEENLRIRDIITPESVRNAISVIMACGCSTNLIIHLKAIIHRCGFDIDLMEFDRISNNTPLLVNCKPSGANPVGAELHNAGGIPAVMKEIKDKLNLDVITCTGMTLGENIKDVEDAYNRDVIKSASDPLKPVGGISILKGNLAPGGAVIKRSAATEQLMNMRGPAKVFDNLKDAEKWLSDPDSPMTWNTVVVLRGYGPTGEPGMSEFGNYLPIPPVLFRNGITDYLRITDSRMSGGCYGSVILHVSPESNLGGPLAAVRDGDIIHVDVDKNLIEVELTDEEIKERLKDHKPDMHQEIRRGYVRMFIDHVSQACDGCDFDFLEYKEE